MPDIWAQYGESFTLRTVLFNYSDGKDVNTSPAMAAGDVTVSKDGAAFTSSANTPANTAEVVSVVLSATEMTCKELQVKFVDQGTPAWLGQVYTIRTYGHPSAQDPRGVILRDSTATASSSSITFASSAGTGVDQYKDLVVRIVSDGSGLAAGQMRYISAYSAVRVATISQAWVNTPTSPIVYEVFSAPAGVSDVNLTTIAGDATSATALKNNIANLDAAISTRATSALTAAAIRAEIDSNSTQLASLVAGSNGNFDGYTQAQVNKIVLAVLAGKLTGADSNSPIFRSINDTKNRVSATTNAAGRSAVTIDAS